MTYSLDFRKKVLETRAREGLSFAKTAKRFGVSVNSLFLWSKNLEPKRTKNKPSLKIDPEALLEDIKKNPDAYNYERAKRFNVSAPAIFYAMKRLGFTYKKNIQSPKSMRREKKAFSKKNRRA